MSCLFIEGGLTLAPDGLYFCSIPLHGTAGWADIGKYNGGALPVDTILAARERHRKALREGTSTTCNGCEGFLSQKEWKKPYIFDNLNIENYTICNLRCSYCCWRTTHRVPSGQYPYQLLPILQQITNQRLIDPKGWLFWGGGEPALLDELGACVDLATYYGLRHDVSSNATIFSRILADLLKDPRNTLVTSVDAGTPETYRMVRGRDDFWRVWANLERYAAVTGGDRVSVKYLLTEGNLDRDDLVGFSRLVKERCLGQSVIVDISHHLGRVPNEWVTAAAELIVLLEANGTGVQVGIHGAHTLPREKFAQRVRERLNSGPASSLSI